MYAAFHDGTRNAEQDVRFQKILAHFGGSGPIRVLDVGCGDGALLTLFRRLGHQTVGLEIDLRSLAVAKQRGIDVEPTDVVEFAARFPGSFDLVCMSDVLEHLTDPVAALDAAQRLLKPSGSLAGTVPNRNRLVVDLHRSDFPPHHFLRFDERSLRACLSRAGLTPVVTELFQYGYTFPAVLGEAIRRVKSFRSPPGESVRAGRPARPAVARPAKRALASALNAALAAASAPIERQLRRGYKIFFVARPDPSSPRIG